jgi:hypothetical protein
MTIDVRDPCVALERNVTRILRDDESHRRVSAALADVAAAAIYPPRLRAATGPVVNGLVDDAVNSAARVAVETLIDELEDVVDALPESVLEKLLAEQLEADLGIE